MHQGIRTAAFRVAAVAALGMIVCPSLPAQDTPQMYRVCEYKIKPYEQADFEGAMKILSAAFKKAGMPMFLVWRETIFGEIGAYVTASPVANYARFDSGSVLNQADSADRVRYTNMMRSAVETSHCYLDQSVPSLTTRSDRREPPKFARLLRTNTLPGKRLEYEEAARMGVEASKKGGAKDIWVFRSVLGTAVNQYTTLTLFDKWAELDARMSVEKAMGADGYKLYMKKVQESIVSAETMVVQYVPEVSYQ